MPDQADQLRELASEAWPTTHGVPDALPLVAVSGARSDIGATTTVINLGAALALGGLRVAIVDANYAQPGIAAAADIDLPPSGESKYRICVRPGHEVELQDGPAGTRVLLPSAEIARSALTSRRAQQKLIAQLQSLRAAFDVIVVDTGSGATPATRRLWQQAQLVLMITTAEAAAMMDAYATIKLAAPDASTPGIRVVINRCSRHSEAEQACGRLSEVSQRYLGRAVLAAPALPIHTSTSGEKDEPPRIWESPETPYAHAVLWLARAVRELVPAISPEPLAA